jgi:hypothetical protein
MIALEIERFKEIKQLYSSIRRSELLKKEVTFKENDVVFVYKSCKFKKRPLNALIKEGKLGIKRTFNIEEATVVVLPDVKYNIFDYRVVLNVVNKDGDEEITDEHRFRYWVNDRYRDEVVHKYGNIHRWSLPNTLEEDFKHLIKGKVCTLRVHYAEIEAEHIKMFLDKDITLVHEDQVQQIVYNTANPDRESITEYNIDAIVDLLKSSDIENNKIAIEIIKNVNIEKDLYTLLKLYCSRSMRHDCKKLFYDNIVKQNPKIKNSRVGDYNYNDIRGKWDVQALVDVLKDIGIPPDPMEVYNDYFHTEYKEEEDHTMGTNYISNMKQMIDYIKYLGLPFDPLVFMEKTFNLTKQEDNNEKEKPTTDIERVECTENQSKSGS